MEALIIIFLLLLNGIFAMAETALISSRKERLEQMANKGSKGAAAALRLLQKPEEFLSTVQVGITLVGVLAGAYGGVALAEDLAPFFEQYAPIKDFALEISFILIVGFITYFSLIIGELVPKTIAYNNPEGISAALAPFIRILSVIAAPVVWFLSISTSLVLALFGIERRKNPPVTEEELKILIEQGSLYGTIEKKETELIKNIFRFGDRKAHSIMINRQDIIWVDINKPQHITKEKIFGSNYSRLPLCDGSIDNVTGIIRVKDYFRSLEKGNDIDLKEIAVQPLFIPENLPALKILDRFRETKVYTAIVINEFGSTEGMITLHDLIENILGEFPERFEEAEMSIVEREDGSLLINGYMLIDELKEKLKVNFDPDEYTTLGGYIMYKLNKIPQEGEHFTDGGYIFEVVDMDDKRVDKVLVKKNTG